MNNVIRRETLLPRISGIQKNIQKLRALSKTPLQEFSSGDAFDLAQHHLRLALEGVFNICSHILARIPGGRAVEYKEIALKMGEHKLVPLDFAKQKLKPMAGLRNMLVHVYSDLDPSRLHEVITNHLDDLETFLAHVKSIIQNPDRFGLVFK
jgi:uncharacterized protein YutE (UPF0331/DUF86 family)